MKKALLFLFLILVFVSPIINANTHSKAFVVTSVGSFELEQVKLSEKWLYYKHEGSFYKLSTTYVDTFYTEEESFTQLPAYRKCELAESDAVNFHGKQWFYSALGFVTLGTAGLVVAVIKPKPKHGKLTNKLSDSKVLFDDPDYLTCYSKKARNQNLFNTLKGASLWMLVVILFA